MSWLFIIDIVVILALSGMMTFLVIACTKDGKMLSRPAENLTILTMYHWASVALFWAIFYCLFYGSEELGTGGQIVAVGHLVVVIAAMTFAVATPNPLPGR